MVVGSPQHTQMINNIVSYCIMYICTDGNKQTLKKIIYKKGELVMQFLDYLPRQITIPSYFKIHDAKSYNKNVILTSQNTNDVDYIYLHIDIYLGV